MRMPRFHASRARVRGLSPLLLACAALIAACSGGEGDPAPAATAPPTAVATPEATATAPPTASPESYAFPTGPAVLVAADYQAPEDRVASTGAYLPSNGKPTLVFVDAIW